MSFWTLLLLCRAGGRYFGLVRKIYEVAGVDLDLVKEGQDEVEVSMCRFTWSVRSTL